MKKKMISLKSLQETLNANELKNILGGSEEARSGVCSTPDSCINISMCWTQATGDGYCKENSEGECACIA